MALDLSELEEVVAPDDSQLKTISTLAEQQLAAELNVEQCTAELTTAKNALNHIRENLLPDAMQAVGMKEFVLESGAKVTIKDEVYASITEANRPSALQWLRAHNHGAIIKNNVTVPYTAADKDFERELKVFLEERDIQYDKKMSVHSRTLQSWVKEQIRQDNEVPESISYYEQRISKVVK